MSFISTRRAPQALAMSIVAALAIPAAAIDGVIGINQVQALAGGVTPGDTPGFPVTISAPGSYILTGNLTVANLNTTAVQVTSTDGVTLDLNGFTIRGACPVAGGCALGAGTSKGIDAAASSGFVVRNGRVNDFANNGVMTGPYARISELFVEGSGGSGITVGAGSEVSDSRVFDSADVGIVATSSTVRDCAAESNRDGMVIGEKSLVLGNTVVGNTRIGLLVNGSGTTVRANVVSLNSTDGIAVTATGSLVADNVTYGNVSAGIAVLASGLVQRNSSFNNALGLYLVPESTPGGAPAAYRGNVVGGNSVGSVSGGVAPTPAENSCNGTATCP